MNNKRRIEELKNEIDRNAVTRISIFKSLNDCEKQIKSNDKNISKFLHFVEMKTLLLEVQEALKEEMSNYEKELHDLESINER